MAVLVDIYVLGTDVQKTPIAGAVVSIYDRSSGVVLSGQATTDANGVAAFSLPGAAEGKLYEVRCYKQDVAFGGASQISVLEPLPNGAPANFNTFDLTGTVQVLPTATDPDMCRCTGRFVDFSNRPIAGATVRITSPVDQGSQTPKVLKGSMVSAEVAALQTDEDGFVTIDLPRHSQYNIMFSGETDMIWNFLVPDRSSANLIDLIHPFPASVTWGTDPLALSVGQMVEVPVTLLFTSYEERSEGLDKWIQVMNSSPSLIDVAFNGAVIQVTGLAPGVATVTATVKEAVFPSRLPTMSTSLPTPLSVTVS